MCLTSIVRCLFTANDSEFGAARASPPAVVASSRKILFPRPWRHSRITQASSFSLLWKISRSPWWQRWGASSFERDRHITLSNATTTTTTKCIAIKSERSSLSPLSLSFSFSLSISLYLSLSLSFPSIIVRRSSSRSSTLFTPATHESTKKDFLTEPLVHRVVYCHVHLERRRRSSSTPRWHVASHDISHLPLRHTFMTPF